MIGNKILRCIFVIILLLNIVFLTNLCAQTTYQWDVLISDSINIPISEAGYTVFKKNIDYIDENNIVGYYDSYPKQSGSLIINRYNVIRLSKFGQEKEVLYVDTTDSDVFGAIEYPNNKVITIAGFQGKLLGNFSGNQYMVSSMLIYSTDAGKNWTRKILDSNETIEDLSMCDSAFGIFAKCKRKNYFNSPKNYVPVYSLLFSNDCWKTINIVKLPAIITDSLSQIKRVYCLSRDKWRILASKKLNGVYFDFILNTNDGGITWSEPLFFEKGYRINDLEFIDDNQIVAVGGYSWGLAETLPLIIKSNNNGLSWTNCLNYNFIEYTEIIKGIDFTDYNNGIAYGSSNSIYRTDDGGSTWKKEKIINYKDDLFKYKHIGNYRIQNLIYPAKNFALASLNSDFFMTCINKEILNSPKLVLPIFSKSQELNNVKIYWDPINGAIEYQLKFTAIPRDSVYIQNLFDFTHPTFDTIFSNNEFFLNNLSPNFNYNIWVKAIGKDSESEWSEPIIIGTKKDMDEIYFPNLIYPNSFKVNTPGDVYFIWNKVHTAQYYSFVLLDGLTPIRNETNLKDTFLLVTLEPSKKLYLILKAYKDDTTFSGASYSFYTWDTALDVVDNEINIPKQYTRSYLWSSIPYPQPAKDIIKSFICWDSYSNIDTDEISVHDVFGQRVQGKENISIDKHSSNSGILTWDCSGIPTGIYFIYITHGVEKIAIKIMVSR